MKTRLFVFLATAMFALLATIVLIGATFALLYRLALRTSGNAPAAAAAAFLAGAASSVHWLARPPGAYWTRRPASKDNAINEISAPL